LSDAPKKLFISYAWESGEYREWVRRLAARFCEDGVEARLDYWHLQPTDTIPEFMNREVRQADWVLVLCSPAYKSKVHATEEGQRSTGVGWEARLLTSRLFISSENKILAALAKGAWTEAAPDFLQGQIYSDLSDPRTFEANYKTLLQRITGTFEPPPPVRPLRPDLKAEPLAPLRYDAPDPGPTEAELLFTVRAGDSEGRWTVELRVDGGEPVSAPFELDLSPDGQTKRDLEGIDRNTCTTDDIQNLGSELWTRLLAGPLEKEWDRVRRQCRARERSILKIRLALPAQFEHLPWESIWDFDESSLATSPVVSVVRSPADEEPVAPHNPSGGASLKMLVVIPAGSGLRTSSEWEKIRQSALAAGDRVEIESLDGQVTLNRLAEALRRDWDIVHFIGHGRLDAQGRVALRLNREEPDGEDWISARLFAQQFLRSPAQLVVVNCCHTASLDPQALSSLSGYLSRARVAATLVMRYAIHDSVAADFSAAFYRELFSGERPGRVDLATQEGRATLERTYRDGDRARGAITPVLYLAAGCEQLFTLPEKESRATAAAAMQAFAVIDERIDRKLVRSIERRCCLPILGPGILSAGAERQEQIPPSPSGLAQRLAQLSAFPGFERITPLTDSTADWLTPVLFERICQHFESSSDGERHALNEAIQEAYRPFVPHPALDQIAAWNVPGVVYTYVDGLLEQSLQRLRGRDLRVVQAEDLREGTLPGSGGLVLMNLRGSYTSPSMILTEEDQDRLLDRISAVASFVADLMNRIGGCNLLFLGISARDPLVRALARRLLRDDVARNRGTAFFICDQTTVADRAYWQQFKKLEWLELDVDTVVAGLTAAARAAPRLEGEP
jgi:hypothetical protein